MLSDAEIRQLAALVYLLMGQHETLVDLHKTIERALSLLPNVMAAEVVPGAGHAMKHTQPDWVIGRVVRFLDQYAA